MDDSWFVYLFLAAFPALIVFAAIYKYIEVLQVRRWPSTQGRVVRAKTEARRVESGGPNSSNTELRNFAKVVYEYEIAGKKYRCDRVSIGEDMGNFEVAETLARYPEGKAVTVYYNPSNRSQALLERELPSFLWKGIAAFLAILAVLIGGSVLGFQQLPGLVKGFVRDPARVPTVAALIGFGLLVTFIVWGIQRAVAVGKTWPKVPGRVTSSSIRSFETRSESRSGVARWSTMYRADVVYCYEVRGVSYTGDKTPVSGTSSNSEALARRMASRYSTGAPVTIHYNPENPSESVADPRAAGLWFLWLAPGAIFALAAVLARV